MANKVIDSDLQVFGNLLFQNLDAAEIGYYIDAIFRGGILFEEEKISIGLGTSRGFNDGLLEFTRDTISSYGRSGGCQQSLGTSALAWIAVYAKKYIVPNGTSAQFLKADGSLDSNAYALHTDLNAVKTNAWKLDEANAECKTVVVSLVGNQSVFERMEKDGISYQTSRNIYVDMSEADSTINNIFAGYENLPVGIRYHIFFGNTKHDCKINWNESKVESNIIPSLGITPAYPTAKCEFMRVTEEWTYADWEAKIENVSHVIDTGTASESDNSTLMNFMDNNKISYEKTKNGALVNISALLAALAGNK